VHNAVASARSRARVNWRAAFSGRAAKVSSDSALLVCNRVPLADVNGLTVCTHRVDDDDTTRSGAHAPRTGTSAAARARPRSLSGRRASSSPRYAARAWAWA